MAETATEQCITLHTIKQYIIQCYIHRINPGFRVLIPSDIINLCSKYSDLGDMLDSDSETEEISSLMVFLMEHIMRHHLELSPQMEHTTHVINDYTIGYIINDKDVHIFTHFKNANCSIETGERLSHQLSDTYHSIKLIFTNGLYLENGQKIFLGFSEGNIYIECSHLQMNCSIETSDISSCSVGIGTTPQVSDYDQLIQLYKRYVAHSQWDAFHDLYEFEDGNVHINSENDIEIGGNALICSGSVLINCVNKIRIFGKAKILSFGDNNFEGIHIKCNILEMDDEAMIFAYKNRIRIDCNILNVYSKAKVIAEDDIILKCPVTFFCNDAVKYAFYPSIRNGIRDGIIHTDLNPTSLIDKLVITIYSGNKRHENK
eukprot:446302_1